MSLYFQVLDAKFLERVIRPALTASWNERRFSPSRELCRLLAPRLADPHDPRAAARETSLLARIADSNLVRFDAEIWRSLVGEVLLTAADDLPDISLAVEPLAWLIERRPLAPEDRSRFGEVEQALFGSRDVVFGGFYRPERAGWNATDDVARLAQFLARIDPGSWFTDDLAGLGAVDDHDDELAFARDRFPAFAAMYDEAAARGRVIVCERLG